MNKTTPTITELVSIIREYNVANAIRSSQRYATRAEVEKVPDDGFEYLRESSKIASNFLQATLNSYMITEQPNPVPQPK
jgi:hypothetical protein